MMITVMEEAEDLRSASLRGVQEDGIFIRSLEPVSVQEMIKAPQGRRVPAWLHFLQPRSFSSNKSSPTNSDIEAEVIRTNSAPPPTSKPPLKGILKPPKPVREDLEHPAPIKKSVFLKHEELVRLSRTRQNSFGDSEDESLSNSLAEALRSNVYETRDRTVRVKFRLEHHYVDTWGREEYDRGGIEYVAKCLTPELALAIKKELNEFKREMPIHDESHHHTQFYQIK